MGFKSHIVMPRDIFGVIWFSLCWKPLWPLSSMATQKAPTSNGRSFESHLAFMVTTWMRQDRVRKEFLIHQNGQDIDFCEFLYHLAGVYPNLTDTQNKASRDEGLLSLDRHLESCGVTVFKPSFSNWSKKECTWWTPGLPWAMAWQLQLIRNVLVAGRVRWSLWRKSCWCSKWLRWVKSWRER